MSEQETQESQKTIVAFVAGLLIGGLLVWVFGGDKHDEMMGEENGDVEVALEESTNDTTTDETTDEAEEATPEQPTMETGKGAVEVANQPAGAKVALGGAVFPNDEGWIGVRDYTNGQLGGILGVARFSKEQGLVPTEVELLRATESGKEYAVVFYTESGDRKFSTANDVLIDDVVTVFTAR